MSDTVYTMVTERIVKALERGVIPWRQPWRNDIAWDGAALSMATGRPYHGANSLLLHPSVCGFSSPWWGTYRAVQSRGGHVRKGERSSIAVLWKWLDRSETKADGTEKGKRVPMLRYFNVFNLDQCESVTGLPKVAQRPEFVPIDECERVVTMMPQRPPVYHDGNGRCFYRPASDTVHMTIREAFRGSEAYYATLFHELSHSTGHASRLDRDMGGGFGSERYSREELVAELASAFLCARCHIDAAPMTDNTAAYLAGWVKALKADVRAVVVAAGAAEKAARFILNDRAPTEAVEEDADAVV